MCVYMQETRPILFHIYKTIENYLLSYDNNCKGHCSWSHHNHVLLTVNHKIKWRLYSCSFYGMLFGCSFSSRNCFSFECSIFSFPYKWRKKKTKLFWCEKRRADETKWNFFKELVYQRADCRSNKLIFRSLSVQLSKLKHCWGFWNRKLSGMNEREFIFDVWSNWLRLTQ